MDPASITETIGLVQKVITLGKKATNLQYEEALLAAREVIFDLREQNLSFREELNTLSEKFKKQQDVRYDSDAGVYWYIEDSTKKRPLCPRCFEKDGVLISLSVDKNSYAYPYCPDCKNSFNAYHE